MNQLELTRHHLLNSQVYAKIVQARFPNWVDPEDVFIHSSLFKTDIFSAPVNEQEYQYESSGTSGNASKIRFNRQDAVEQQRYLLSTMRTFHPFTRNSVFVEISHTATSHNNARKAASRGFSLLSRRKVIVKNQKELEDAFELASSLSHEIIIFGFTAEIYAFFREVRRDLVFNSPRTVLIHGGGWKRLESSAVSVEAFNAEIKGTVPGASIINYYGMVEQLGLVYPSCKIGNYHVPDSANIIIRDQFGRNAGSGREGLIQSLSPLPRSYPGHSLLTDDIGIINPEPCACGRKGVNFRVLGRVNAQVPKGCSDAYL